MSDSVPTEDDYRIASIIMTDDSGEYCAAKIAGETARHRRVLLQTTMELAEIKRCIKGDAATGYTGMQAKLDDAHDLATETHSMVCEIYKNNTGKEPVSDSHALERKKKESDNSKYIWIGVGIVSTLAWLLPLIWGKLFT